MHNLTAEAQIPTERADGEERFLFPPLPPESENKKNNFSVRLWSDNQDQTLQAIRSNGVATVTLRRMFSAMAAEKAKKRSKLVTA
jgi:hypothetical protein